MTGTYTDAHVGTAKVKATDSGTFALPSVTASVRPTALAVGKTMHVTASGVFFTTGKDNGGAFYEEGVFSRSRPDQGSVFACLVFFLE